MSSADDEDQKSTDVELLSMSLTDEEIEQSLQDLAKKKTFTSVTPTASALASKALTIPKQHKDDATKKSTNTNKEIISLSEARVDKLVTPIQKDFEAQISKWPKPLQDYLRHEDGDPHEWLYFVVVPFLMKALNNYAISRKFEDAVLQMIQAIATYKSRFTPLKEVGKILMRAGKAIMWAIGNALAFAVAAIVAEFGAAISVALMALLIGVGLWRGDVFLIKMGLGSMFGFGVGFMFGGPAGAVAGSFIGGSVAGWMGLPPG